MAKHAMLGLARSVMYDAEADGIVCSLVAPWFCPTKILSPPTLFSLAGLPLTEASKVVDAMLFASTTTRSGDVLAVDAEGVLRLPHPVMDNGTQTNYYTLYRDRGAFILSVRAAVRQGARIALRGRGWNDSQITAIKWGSLSLLVAGFASFVGVASRFV